MTDQQTEQQRTWEVADCFFELIGRIVGQAEQTAQRFAVPAPFIKALHFIDVPIPMRDLGKRLHCDPSFVTLIADMLEKRGLATREQCPEDRRVKNIVLTDEGQALKRKLESEISARMPWNMNLTEKERAQLLALLRKMLRTDADGAATTGAATPDAMHGPLVKLLVTALQDSAPQDSAPQDSAPQDSTPQDSAPHQKAPKDQAPRTRRATTSTPPAKTGEVTDADRQVRQRS